MRIDELRNEIEKLGQKYDEKFIVRKYTAFISIYVYRSDEYYHIASTMLEKQYAFNTINEIFDDLPKELQEKLFNIIVEFARKPEKEREEEKKYQYKLKGKYWWILKDFEVDKIYLNFIVSEYCKNPLLLNDCEDLPSDKTIFTDKEIKEVAEKFDVDLEMFDKIEVTDE